MTVTAIARVSPSHDGLRRPSVPRPRRAIACRWELRPETGSLACRCETVPPALAPVQGAARERGQPPSFLPLAA